MNAWGIAAMLGCAVCIGGGAGFIIGARFHGSVAPVAPKGPIMFARTDRPGAIPVYSIGDAALSVMRSIPTTARERNRAAARDLRERAASLRKDAKRFIREAEEFEAEIQLDDLTSMEARA